MPTYEALETFLRDFDRLSPGAQDQFWRALEKFIEDADSGKIRASLRVKPLKGERGIWEMTWEGARHLAAHRGTRDLRPAVKRVLRRSQNAA